MHRPTDETRRERAANIQSLSGSCSVWNFKPRLIASQQCTQMSLLFEPCALPLLENGGMAPPSSCDRRHLGTEHATRAVCQSELTTRPTHTKMFSHYTHPRRARDAEVLRERRREERAARDRLRADVVRADEPHEREQVLDELEGHGQLDVRADARVA